MRVGIIGGGFSGIIAGIYASKNNNEVVVLERNSTPLKKLLLTGNGKCNYYNEIQDLNKYNSSSSKLIGDIIYRENLQELKNFYDNIGIIPKIKNGYYYPNSNTATSIKETLLKETSLNNVIIKTDFLAKNIKKVNDKFIVSSDYEELEFDIIVIATGGKSYSKTGSDGIGYELVKKFGHTIVPLLSSLNSVVMKESYLKDWAGIRCDANLKLYENDKLIAQEDGELQLTNYGLSGICIFNLCSKISKGLYNKNKEVIKINFLPNINNLEEFLEKRAEKLVKYNLMEMLESLINYKLLKVIFKESKIDYTKHWVQLSDKEKSSLINNLSEFEAKIIEVSEIENGQVTCGGVNLDEINLSSMESKKCSKLYLVGEILDVDGLCGGYNLTFAFISGMLAGKSIKW